MGLKPLAGWARAKGTKLRGQIYGTPPATLSSNAFADLFEGEGVEWRQLSATRWASSASHFYGRPITSSETWTWLHSPSFRATPLDIKAEADVHFLQGINQLIGHGWPYTPEGVEYPGWRFYAAAVFNDKNPWWPAMPDVASYLQRVSHLLRQGEPVNDVAIYAPLADTYSRFSPGRVHLFAELRDRIGREVVEQVLDSGHGFDFVDDGMIEQGGVKHRILVLPAVERMPAAVARKLEEFARSGGILLATRRRPDTAPGRMATDADHQAVRGMASRTQLVEDDRRLGARLGKPDVAFEPAAPALGFVHRRTPFAEIYFLANTGNTRVQTLATFRVEGLTAEWWDPLTGRARTADTNSTQALDLEPYGSRVVVFSKTPAPVEARHPVTVPDPQDLSNGWSVTFGERRQQMVQLTSWSADPDTRYLSGVASYEKSFPLPNAWAQPGLEITLDFGEGVAVAPSPRRNGMRAWLDAPVRDAAVVYVNGTRAGAVWCPPYSVRLTGLVRGGETRLRIEVGNTAINYMAGRSLPDYRLLNLRYGVRFEPQDMANLQPLPSGLLGPVRLVGR